MSMVDTVLMALTQYFHRDADPHGSARQLLGKYDVTLQSDALSVAEDQISLAIDRCRAEFPGSDAMTTRRLGMRAAERVVRGVREEIEKSEESRREADASPEFFRPGRLYAYDIWRFQCATVTTHPETGERVAIGWIRISDGSWTTYAYSAAEWGVDLWTDVTEGGGH